MPIVVLAVVVMKAVALDGPQALKNYSPVPSSGGLVSYRCSFE